VASAVAVLAALGASTGLLGASLPAPAQAEPVRAGLLPGLGELLPLPSPQPPSEPPSSEQPSPPEEPSRPPAEQPSAPPSGSPAPAKPPSSGGGLLAPLLPGGQRGQQPGGQQGQQPGGLLPGVLPPSGGGPLPALPGPALPGLALPVGPPVAPRAGPGNAWSLTGTSMKLVGSHYHGVETQQVGGQQVRTLHFTVDRLEVGDLVQQADLGNGRIATVAARPGSTSTVTSGPIDLYVREMSGTLSAAGLPAVPLRLTPETLGLANLDLGFLQLPTLDLHHVAVNNALLSGGKLVIPGSRITLGR